MQHTTSVSSEWRQVPTKWKRMQAVFVKSSRERASILYSIDSGWITHTVMRTYFCQRTMYALHWTFQTNAFNDRITSHNHLPIYHLISYGSLQQFAVSSCFACFICIVIGCPTFKTKRHRVERNVVLLSDPFLQRAIVGRGVCACGSGRY